jgi:hypothetical protein
MMRCDEVVLLFHATLGPTHILLHLARESEDVYGGSHHPAYLAALRHGIPSERGAHVEHRVMSASSPMIFLEHASTPSSTSPVWSGAVAATPTARSTRPYTPGGSHSPHMWRGGRSGAPRPQPSSRCINMLHWLRAELSRSVPSLLVRPSLFNILLCEDGIASWLCPFAGRYPDPDHRRQPDRGSQDPH